MLRSQLTKMVRIYLILLVASCKLLAQDIQVSNNRQIKKVRFGNSRIQMELSYSNGVSINAVSVNSQRVISNNGGIYSMIKTASNTYSSLQSSSPAVTTSGNIIKVNDIIYGDHQNTVKENWMITVTNKDISINIKRQVDHPILAEKTALPIICFDSISTWEGAYQDYGGIAWFYLFNQQNETYGVHSSSSKFWNSKTGNGLSVNVSAPGKQVAMDYSRTKKDQLTCGISIADKELKPGFDSGTNRRRFVRDTSNVWQAVEMKAGTTTQTISFSYFDFNEQYGRGKLQAINTEQANAVLNTIARIGVIDKKHFGGNSWHTPYGPICLHEQYIAQMGLAINDDAYLNGYKDCLDFYRDNAIKPSGRVWARWAYTNEDMMPGEVTDKGFYEAQWGYLMDANPDFVTNVSELYDQNGNLDWVRTHKQSCEKALDWIINRDSNHNGLVEMMTDSTSQRRGSDWIDIIWAAYENAFVNAKLYHALQLWSAIEQQLGDEAKANYYRQFAEQLKNSFNKPTTQGGFWDEAKQCYVHWRDKDGSTHGNNLVTPVNFMAIGYGICDDKERIKNILDNIETQMQKENLFFWPICMYTYQLGEGNDWQFPFPNYENGDLFLSWGAMGVKAYASYKPEIAVKYVKKVLERYAQDGLAFQRYGRLKQDGLGDDILSGNSLAVVGLFNHIYGINPLYNRFYLDPHITNELAGTQLKYRYRKQLLTIDLNSNQYKVSNGQFGITASQDFGFFATTDQLQFFHQKNTSPSLEATVAAGKQLQLTIRNWEKNTMNFTQSNRTSAAVSYHLYQLEPDSEYEIMLNQKKLPVLKSKPNGSLQFNCPPSSLPVEIRVSLK